MLLPFQPEPMHPVFHPLKDRAARQNCRSPASLIGKSPRRQSPHLQIIHIDAAIPIANTVVQHHRDWQLRVLQKLQIRIGRIADDGRMAVCATGQYLAFLQVVVDIRVDDQPHRTCRFFDLGPQTIPEAEHHAGPEILCPEHGHHQLIGTAAAPQTPGSHIGLVAKPCRRRKNFFLRGRADLPLCRLAAQNKEAGKEAWDKHIKICTNAGGMNINGCVDGIRQWAEGNSMSGYKIGYVTGDNIKDKIPQLLKDGWTFPNFDYDGNFNDILDKIYNCNVYIGHEGIEGCLAEGADVVITGRAADSALFLAPLKYEFGWAADDWDNLARGIMAGHLLECGGQGAGGNYMYDWRNVPRMDELGFPIAELTDDTFEITKAPDCGGIICEQSCKEQFLYEVHDPANYLTPDVNVDISHATITQVGDNRVRIGGVKGKPRPDTLKLCVGYHKGWKTVSMLSFAWPDAYEKAQYCAEVIMKKMQRRGMKADDIHISYIGLNSLHLGVADMSEEALKNLNECVLRIAVFSEDKSECAKIIPEISPLQLNGPPGASFFGGRARVQEVMALWPTTVPRDAVQVESHILEVK